MATISRHPLAMTPTLNDGTRDGDALLPHCMTIRQNNWTLGPFCESHCRAVAGHNTLEDRSVFPHLRRREQELAAVLERFAEKDETIAAILDRIDTALLALVANESGALKHLTQATHPLTDAMNSHLSYEERELVVPLARLG